MLSIALYEPKIPANTGNIIRLAANCGFNLHLIEPLGFNFEDKQLKRAGLDYHDLAVVTIHTDFEAFLSAIGNRRILVLSTKATTFYQNMEFRDGDVLLFGSEPSGIPDAAMDRMNGAIKLRVPMRPNVRSLNLSNTVSIVCYEAWRQMGFQGAA